MTNTNISIAGVSERDIDLLLLEEFLTTKSFQIWFVDHALGASANLGTCVSAHRSVTQSTGESDLEVGFRNEDGRRTRLLIENKVHANLQPQQAERYHIRGDDYVVRGECDVYHTIIVAPDRYFSSIDDMKGFECRITYESIRDWFLQADDLGDRKHYKAALLQSAIDKGVLGYQPVEDAAATDFWRNYWNYARRYAPKLEMRKPGVKPSTSTFVYFHPPLLPAGVQLVHKLTDGYVDLQLQGMGNKINSLHAAIESSLSESMMIASAEKSAAIRILTPKLNTNEPAKHQLSAIRSGLDASKLLLAWLNEHKDVLTEYMNAADR